MSNINKEQLEDTIRKLDSIVSAGHKVTSYDRFILTCLQHLQAIHDEPVEGGVVPQISANLEVLQVIPNGDYRTVVMEAHNPPIELTVALHNEEFPYEISPLDVVHVDFTLAEREAVNTPIPESESVVITEQVPSDEGDEGDEGSEEEE
jgi:hypothetical protein